MPADEEKGISKQGDAADAAMLAAKLSQQQDQEMGALEIEGKDGNSSRAALAGFANPLGETPEEGPVIPVDGADVDTKA